MSTRKAVRAAFVDLLKDANVCSGRIYPSRSRPVAANALPAVLVFSAVCEPLGTLISSNAPDAWRYQLRADVLVKDTGAEDAADDVLDAIMAAVFASQSANTLAGAVHGIRLVEIGEPDLDDSLEKPAIRLPVLFETVFD